MTNFQAAFTVAAPAATLGTLNYSFNVRNEGNTPGNVHEISVSLAVNDTSWVLNDDTPLAPNAVRRGNTTTYKEFGWIGPKEEALFSTPVRLRRLREGSSGAGPIELKGGLRPLVNKPNAG
jgi:hypothetical protein